MVPHTARFSQRLPSLPGFWEIIKEKRKSMWGLSYAYVVAVIYGLILGFFVYKDKDFTLRNMPGLLSEAVIFYSLALFAVCNAMPMGWLIAYLDGPVMLTSVVQGLVSSYYGVYAAIVVILLILGTFLSPTVIIVIFLPVLQALGNMVGIHPVHLGVITVMVLGIGQITPPYGICLLIASEIGKVPVMRLSRPPCPSLQYSWW